MTTADLPPRDPLLRAYDAALERTAAHYAHCPGCQHGLPCPIWKRLWVEQELELDAAAKAMLEGL